MTITTDRRGFLGGALAFAALGCRSTGPSASGARAAAGRMIADGLASGVVCASNRAFPRGFALGTVGCAPEPASVDTLFDLASVSKTFTACAAALAVTDGALDPDAPFTKYLPEHALGARCGVTVRDLAAHAGGFSNRKGYQVADPAEFERRLRLEMPVRQRRTIFEYACVNYILLGRVVERATGAGLGEYCRRRLFGPLGMTETGWGPLAPAQVARVATLATAPRRDRPADESAFVVPTPIGNAGAYSTVGDMMRFASDLLARRVFPAPFYDLVFTPEFAAKDLRGRDAVRTFGFEMSPYRRPAGLSARAVWHTGWVGHTLCVDPGSGFCGVVLTVRKGDHDRALAARADLLSRMAAEADA